MARGAHEEDGDDAVREHGERLGAHIPGILARARQLVRHHVRDARKRLAVAQVQLVEARHDHAHLVATELAEVVEQRVEQRVEQVDRHLGAVLPPRVGREYVAKLRDLHGEDLLLANGELEGVRAEVVENVLHRGGDVRTHAVRQLGVLLAALAGELRSGGRP